MLSPVVDEHGFTAAICVCDICSHETRERAKHERVRGSASKRPLSEGQVLLKLQGQGWTYVKKTLRCPACEAERRKQNQDEKQMKEEAVVLFGGAVAPTDATREQKRQISALLDVVYDPKAERYLGKETDATVADALGPEFQIAWVAKVREDLYGLGTGNDEWVEMTATLAAMQVEFEDRVSALRDCLDTAERHMGSIGVIRDRLAEMERRVAEMAGGRA